VISSHEFQEGKSLTACTIGRLEQWLWMWSIEIQAGEWPACDAQGQKLRPADRYGIG